MTDCLLCNNEATDLVQHDFGPVRVDISVCKDHAPADQLKAALLLAEGLGVIAAALVDTAIARGGAVH